MKELCPQGKNLQLDDSPQSFWYTQIFSEKKESILKRTLVFCMVTYYGPVKEEVSPFSALLHWSFVLTGK